MHDDQATSNHVGATDTACPPRHRLAVRYVTGAIDLSIPLSSEVRECSPNKYLSWLHCTRNASARLLEHVPHI